MNSLETLSSTQMVRLNCSMIDETTSNSTGKLADAPPRAKRKMHVAQIGTAGRPVRPEGAGAIEKIIFYISKYLVETNVSVSIIDVWSRFGRMRGSNSYLFRLVPRKPNNNLLHLVKMSIFSLYSVFVVSRLTWRGQLDVVHTHTQFAVGSMVLARRLLRLRFAIVHTFHEHYLFDSLPAYWRIIELYGLRGANRVIAQTPSVGARLVRDFSIPQDKVIVIPSGIDEDGIRAFSKEPIFRQPDPSHQRTILSVGRISPRKNQLALARAAAIVHARMDDVKFILAGPLEDTQYLSELRGYIRSNDLESVVQVVGEVSSTELYRYYTNAKIFVLPSLNESSPTQALLEAMRFRVPAVVSKIGPMADLENYVPGARGLVYVNPSSPSDIADKLIMLLENTEMQEQTAEYEGRLMSTFEWGTLILRIIDVYSVAIRETRRGS